jgi:hypothetical protein
VRFQFALGLMLLLYCFDTIGQVSRFNYPGGVAVLSIEKQSDDLPEIKYGTRDPVVMDLAGQWQVLIGISLQTLPGEYLLYIKPAVKDMPAQHKTFNVKQYSYPLHSETNRSITNSFREHEQLSEIAFENTQQPYLPLLYPADGQWSDSFGHTVYDMDEQKSVAQNLVSLTTTKLLTVVAPQNAIVSKIETDANQASTIFLDHGRGLYSVVGGVTDLSIEVGNGVLAGAVIGKLPPQSSNEEPKKLTWQCILNGVYVNPIILTQL